MILAALGARAEAADIVFVSDFDNGHPIQWVRHHDAAAGVSIVLGPALVTATLLTNSNTNLTAYLQVPPSLNSNPLYPQWSALRTFGSSAGGVPAVGNCVRAEGTIGQYAGASDLEAATLTLLPPQDCGNDTIAPLSVTVAELATDGDINNPGFQPGPFAEPYESVLVRLSSLIALTANDSGGDFTVQDTASGPNAYVFVANNIYQYNTTQYAAIYSITGVFDEADNFLGPFYRLLPRSGADVVQ